MFVVATPTHMAMTCVTLVENAAGLPEPLRRPSPATGHQADIPDVYGPSLGYDAEHLPFQSPNGRCDPPLAQGCEGRSVTALPETHVFGAREGDVSRSDLDTRPRSSGSYETKAKEFYVDFLGFNVDWEHRFEEDLPLYMQISKDGCIIHLSEHHGDGSPGAAMRIETNELEAFHQELLAKGYKYARPGIQEMPWGSREMSIADPFGNRLTFPARSVPNQVKAPNRCVM
jgi:uncharacterized glyoxalase superfamily protein PhnB